MNGLWQSMLSPGWSSMHHSDIWRRDRRCSLTRDSVWSAPNMDTVKLEDRSNRARCTWLFFNASPRYFAPSSPTLSWPSSNAVRVCKGTSEIDRFWCEREWGYSIDLQRIREVSNSIGIDAVPGDVEYDDTLWALDRCQNQSLRRVDFTWLTIKVSLKCFAPRSLIRFRVKSILVIDYKGSTRERERCFWIRFNRALVSLGYSSMHHRDFSLFDRRCYCLESQWYRRSTKTKVFAWKRCLSRFYLKSMIRVDDVV